MQIDDLQVLKGIDADMVAVSGIVSPVETLTLLLYMKVCLTSIKISPVQVEKLQPGLSTFYPHKNVDNLQIPEKHAHLFDTKYGS